MSKVHRRKKIQITKDFICTYGCGKAYGSYAALYTHIKNKHSNSNDPLPKIEGNLVRAKNTGRKGRPIKKQKQQRSNNDGLSLQCKICQDEQCCCDSQISNSDVIKTIKIMESPTFVEFINLVGQLQVSEMLNCIRDSQQDHEQLSTQRIRQMYNEFLMKCKKDYEISNIWIQFLSFSSRYWNAKSIKQLYMIIFLILSIQQWQLQKVIQQTAQFSSIMKFVENRSKQWIEFVAFLQRHR